MNSPDIVDESFAAYDSEVHHLCRTDSDCYRAGWTAALATRAGGGEGERVTTAEASLGMTTPWPLRDVLARLADFAHDRLVNHDYDGNGWEELQRAKDEAREMLANWPAATSERWIPWAGASVVFEGNRYQVKELTFDHGTVRLDSGAWVAISKCEPTPPVDHPEPSKPRRFPVTDDALDAPDGAIVDGYQRSGDEWVKLPVDHPEPMVHCTECKAAIPARSYHLYEEWQHAGCGGLVKDHPEPGTPKEKP